MARPRKAPAEIEIPEDRPIPEEYEHRPDPWRRAYAHAANYSKYNSVKACVLFAEARWQDAEFQDAAEEE